MCSLYSTEYSRCLTFNLNLKLDTLIAGLLELENMYCIELDQSDVDDDLLSSFIKQVVDAGFGDLKPVIAGELKPISMVPVLKMQGALNTRRIDHYIKHNDNMMGYLHEVEVCLNKSIVNGESLKSISYSDLLNFIESINIYKNWNKITISGEDIFLYPQFEAFNKILDEYSIQKTYVLNLKNCSIDKSKYLFAVMESTELRINVESGFDKEKLEEVVYGLNNEEVSIELCFEITSEEDYHTVEEAIESLKLINYTIKPLFTGDNLPFFEENIYLTKEDINTIALTKREIFAHQAVNTNYFGKIWIKSDGVVHANNYAKPIGHISEPVNDMLIKEMTLGTSWRNIRNQAPCNNCVYQWLCPSPSDLESAIGKPNLCHVKMATENIMLEEECV